MKLTVNGKPYEYSGEPALEALLRELKITTERVAILVNDDVVSAGQRKSISLKEGDCVEFLTFAGGG